MRNRSLVTHLRQSWELDDEECALLDALEPDPRPVTAGELLRCEGDAAPLFYTLRAGWAYASRTLADGERQVLDIFLPGQIMGLREVSLSTSLSDLVALSDAEVCAVPRSRLLDIFEHSRRLSALLFMAVTREETVLLERIVNISRRPAAQRLGHFVLELQARLGETSAQFDLPMNQPLLGDTLGMSAVHVSRSLKVLRDDGLLDITEGSAHILDAQRLRAFSGFNPAYLHCGDLAVHQQPRGGAGVRQGMHAAVAKAAAAGPAP